VVHYETSIALSTVEKTWKPLSEASREELEQLAKKVERYVLAIAPAPSVPTADTRL